MQTLLLLYIEVFFLFFLLYKSYTYVSVIHIYMYFENQQYNRPPLNVRITYDGMVMLYKLIICLFRGQKEKSAQSIGYHVKPF